MQIKIIEEDGDNTLYLDNEHAYFTVDVYPANKTYRSRMRLKDDVYYRTQNYEYRILKDHVRVETRLTERVDEPPERYCVKDGVVLELDILAESGKLMSSMTKEFIDDLKKEVQWHEEWVGDPVSMYLLSKHSEIISPDDYRRYLRQLSEKIKIGTQKVQKVLEADHTGLQVTDEYEGSGRTIWYPKSKQDQMSENEVNKAIEHKNKIQEKLFDEKSKDYVGITESEFRGGADILKHIDVFLNKKPNPIKKDGPKISKTKGIVISLLLTLFLSWVVSWFVDINPFLIFVLVQVISFFQSIIGGWIERKIIS